MSNNKFFRNAYPTVKDPLLHNQRDADSFIQLMPFLIGRGYEYGGLYLNFPPEDGNKPVQSDTNLFQKGDLIVMTTRPPLDDEEEGPHLVISRSGTKLENDIFVSLRGFLPTCSRRQVTLNPSFEDKFKTGYGDRISIQFTGHGKNTRYINVARYQLTVNTKKRIREWTRKDGIRTAAYLIYTGEAWNGGPDLLISFGMTGTCNLIWAHLIRTKFPQFLDSYRVVVAEMIIGDFPDIPVSLSFAEDWDVKILLDHEL